MMVRKLLASSRPSLFVGGPKDGEAILVDRRCHHIQYIQIHECPVTYRAYRIIYDEFPWMDPVESVIFVKTGLNFGFG